MNIDTSTRTSHMLELDDYCHLSKPHDFVEVTTWSNGEGYDVTLQTGTTGSQFQITHGQFQALTVLINYQGKSEPKDIA